MLIFVDFDDTLCLHKDNIYTEKFITGAPEYIAHKAYTGSAKNKKLEKWILDKQDEFGEDVKVIMLSKASSFMHEAKMLWMKIKMPDVKIYKSFGLSVDVGSKALVVEAYVNQNSNEDVFFIDDDPFERRSVMERCPNVVTVSPQYIMNI